MAGVERLPVKRIDIENKTIFAVKGGQNTELEISGNISIRFCRVRVRARALCPPLCTPPSHYPYPGGK